MVTVPLILLGVAAYGDRALIEMENAQRVNRRIKARYVARAGLQKAARVFLDDSTFRGTVTDVDFADGTYSYTVAGDEVYDELGARVRISAQGTHADPIVGEMEAEVTAILQLMGNFVIDYAVASWGRISMNGGARIGDSFNPDNKLYAGNMDPATAASSLYGQGSTFIYGAVELVTSTPQTALPNIIPGPVEYGVHPMTFPSFSVTPLKTKAIDNLLNPQYPGGAYFAGDVIFEEETLRGVIYVEGSVRLKGGVTIDQGCIVQVGNHNISVEGTLTHTPAQDPVTGAPNLAFLKTGGGTLSFSPSSIVNIEGYIFSTDPISFDADGVIRGGLICEQDVNLGGNGQIYFERIEVTDLAQEVRITQDGYLEVISWVESSN
ncbi:MAG: hypothetical protein O7H41_02335 [Planctomycetota bacterium]|nr:hypothetical protein [Planctomycetota bacterium]